jgi:Fe-S cluster biogenesis protein NfuA
MFIQTEDTPNPLTLKFLPGRAVLGEGDGNSFEILDLAQAAKCSPLAEALFEIDGVRGVFLGHDFISVTRAEEVEWEDIKPFLLEIIMDHFLSGRPVVTGSRGAEPASDDEVVQKICALLDERIRPAVANDGGDIVFHKFEDGIVYLSLRGACAGCPSANVTLKMGVERMLQYFIPEVIEVRQVRL